MIKKYLAYLAEDDGIDAPTKSKEFDYDEIEKTLKKLIKQFTAVENVPHKGELSTEIKILKTFEDKISYLKKYDESGKWD